MVLLDVFTSSNLLWSLFVSITRRGIVPDKSSILFSNRLLSILSVLSTICSVVAAQPKRKRRGKHRNFTKTLFIFTSIITLYQSMSIVLLPISKEPQKHVTM